MHEDLLKRHLELVIEANKTTNITRISSWEDGMVLHVQDSLLAPKAATPILERVQAILVFHLPLKPVGLRC